MLDRSVRSGTTVSLACVLLIACLLLAAIIWRQGSEPVSQTYRQSRLLLDTVVELMLDSPDEALAHTAIEAAFAEMQRVEDLLSKYQEESQIYLINQQAGQMTVTVEDEVKKILERSLRYSQQTDRLFDIRIGPLVDLWGIGTEREQVPLRAELDKILRDIKSTQLDIGPNAEVFLRPSQGALDLGGIAKGYSIDRAIDVLKQHGITSALLNAGGDIRCIGAKRDGKPWRIGVKHPREEGIFAVVALQDNAIATSGDYERFFLQEERRYHHLLDPRSGFPARDCQSVTILAPSAEQADVMATAVFIMGPDRGREFIETHADIEGMIVDVHGEIVKSSGFSFQPK